MARLLLQYGRTVDLVPPTSEKTAAGLAELAVDLFDLAQWWAMVSTWLAAQPDAVDAAADLVDELASRGLPLLIMVLSGAPEADREPLIPLLQSLAEHQELAHDPLQPVISSWLLERRRWNGEHVEDATTPPWTLLSLGAFCAFGDGDVVAKDFARDFEESAQRELIVQAGQLVPPLVLDLLSALGQHHPDKQLAKAARKELFRVRTKLASGS